MISKTFDTFLIGKSINFRSVSVEDSAFILELRLNPVLNRYIHKVSPDIERQIEWIANYLKERKEFYFIIEDKATAPLGTLRIYDFIGDSFCWGSWIIKSDAPKYTAIESVFLLYEFAFKELGFKRSHFDVRKDNRSVIDFHLRMGAKIINETDIDLIFTYSIENYENVKLKYKKYLP